MKQFRWIGLWMVTCFFLACGHQEQTPTEATAKARLEMAEKALADDSVRLGETLLRQAITLAEESEDWHTCYIAHQRLAESLSWSNTSEALRLMKRAIDIYEQHPDNERNHIILLDYAGTYASQLAYNAEDADADNAKDTYAEALALTERAHDLAIQANETDLECQTLTSLANIHWAMEDYPVALDYARQAEKLATPDLLQGTLQVLARCYLDCDSLAQAEATYRRMDAGYDIHTAYIIQSNLAKIAVRRHEANEAEEAIDSAFEEAENFYFKALEQKDDYYQATLEQERENERLTYTSNMHRRTFVVVVAALVILLIAMALIWRYRMRMLRRQRAIERRMHEQETRLLEQEKRMLELKTASQLTQLHQAEEVVAFLKSYILQRSEVVQKLSKATASHINLDAKEWADVERTLNAIDGDRFVHLRQTHPELKEEDVQLCILTRLQLSNRSIGNIYGLTISAVQHRKLKLKKDLFGETDPDVTLEQVINQLIQPQQA